MSNVYKLMYEGREDEFYCLGTYEGDTDTLDYLRWAEGTIQQYYKESNLADDEFPEHFFLFEVSRTLSSEFVHTVEVNLE